MHPKMHSMQQKHLFLFKIKQSSEMCLSLAPYELKGVSMPKIQDGVTKWKYKKSLGCYYLCHAITISVAQTAQMTGLCPVEPTRSTESDFSEELTYACQNPDTSFLNPSAVFPIILGNTDIFRYRGKSCGPHCLQGTHVGQECMTLRPRCLDFFKGDVKQRAHLASESHWYFASSPRAAFSSVCC